LEGDILQENLLKALEDIKKVGDVIQVSNTLSHNG